MVHHTPVDVVIVVMVMRIECKPLDGMASEQVQELRMCTDHLGLAGAAHVPVQAQHGIRGRHHQVQVVRDHQHRTAVTLAHRVDETVKLCLPLYVHALGRFVEHQQLWLAQQRAREQDTLELTSRDGGKGCVEQPFDAHFCGNCGQRHRAAVFGKAQEAPHAERQARIDCQSLWHVADAQSRPAPHAATAGCDEAHQDAQQRGLARTVWPDDGEDLAFLERQRHLAQNGFLADRPVDCVRLEKAARRAHGAAPVRTGQRPGSCGVIESMRHIGLLAVNAVIERAASTVAAGRSGSYIVTFRPESCMFSRFAVRALLVVSMLPGLVAGSIAHAVPSGQPLVVSSIRPLHLIVVAIAGDQVDARQLLEDGASAHDFALRPSQMRLLRDARQVFWIDATLEHPLQALFARLSGPRRDTALLPLLELPPRADGVVDPHVWLDPQLALALAQQIARVLVEQGLVREEELRLDAFAASMHRAEARMAAELSGLQDRPFAAMHDGYAYFVQRFGLQTPVVLALDAEQQVGARTLQRMRREVREHGARCLLGERSGASPRLARSIAAGAGIPLIELDTLAVGTPVADGALARFMVDFAHGVADCLRSPPAKDARR